MGVFVVQSVLTVATFATSSHFVTIFTLRDPRKNVYLSRNPDPRILIGNRVTRVPHGREMSHPNSSMNKKNFLPMWHFLIGLNRISLFGPIEDPDL